MGRVSLCPIYNPNSLSMADYLIVFNVQTYGAVGDGSTDDTTTFEIRLMRLQRVRSLWWPAITRQLRAFLPWECRRLVHIRY